MSASISDPDAAALYVTGLPGDYCSGSGSHVYLTVFIEVIWGECTVQWHICTFKSTVVIHDRCCCYSWWWI